MFVANRFPPGVEPGADQRIVHHLVDMSFQFVGLVGGEHAVGSPLFEGGGDLCVVVDLFEQLVHHRAVISGIECGCLLVREIAFGIETEFEFGFVTSYGKRKTGCRSDRLTYFPAGGSECIDGLLIVLQAFSG